MSQFIMLWDSVKRKKVKSTLTIDDVGGSFIDYDFDVSGGGVTNFPIPADITALQKIDSWVNGSMRREGGSEDWTRDNGNDEINYNQTVEENAWVRIRVFS